MNDLGLSDFWMTLLSGFGVGVAFTIAVLLVAMFWPDSPATDDEFRGEM